MATEEAQYPVTHDTHVGIDTMSNISTITPGVARRRNMRIENTKKPIYFGSATHGGLVEVRQVAKSTLSPYLGSLVVTHLLHTGSVKWDMNLYYMHLRKDSH